MQHSMRSNAHSARNIQRAWLAASVICAASLALPEHAHTQPAGPSAEPRQPDDVKDPKQQKPEASGDDDKPPQPGTGPQVPKKPQDIATADVVRANLETSYLTHPFSLHGVPPLIFECSIAPHFFVHTGEWPFAFVLTPKILLRMFNENSSPVRSPSFMPRVSVFVWFQQRLTGTPTFYGSVTLSHHSNGQTGPFFADDGSVNHQDGSFSTNFLDFAVYGTGFTGRFLGWSSLSLQWHPGFNQDPELKGRYGLVRLNLATTIVADLPLHGQVNLRVSAILDDFQRASKTATLRALERFPFSLSYSMTVPGIDLGVYLGYYIGHDYYNIWFDRVIHTIQIGISGGYAPTLLKSEVSD
jgi:hypothetical protein